MFVHLQFVTVHIQKPWVSGEFVGNYTLLWNHSEPVQLPTFTPAPNLHHRCLWHTYSETICCQNLISTQFWRHHFIFHSCPRLGVMGSSLSTWFHLWYTFKRNICRPSMTSDNGCNYDRPDAPLSCTARMLLAALHFMFPMELTRSSPDWVLIMTVWNKNRFNNLLHPQFFVLQHLWVPISPCFGRRKRMDTFCALPRGIMS